MSTGLLAFSKILSYSVCSQQTGSCLISNDSGSPLMNLFNEHNHFWLWGNPLPFQMKVQLWSITCSAKVSTDK